MAHITFGEKLREYRRAAGLSQRVLARLVGVDFSYISKVENGRLPPPAADTIVKICGVIKTDPEELLALTGKLPSEVRETVGTKRVAQEFLREVQRMDLTDAEWETMIKELGNLRDDTQ